MDSQIVEIMNAIQVTAPFNSIEWIPRTLAYVVVPDEWISFNSIEWILGGAGVGAILASVVLSIPLNGFLLFP